MKRWVFRILMCVVLGVVTTVGVAWGLAVLSQTHHLVQHETFFAPTGLTVRKWLGKGGEFSPLFVSKVESRGATDVWMIPWGMSIWYKTSDSAQRVVVPSWADIPTERFTEALRTARGWPCLSMSSRATDEGEWKVLDGVFLSGRIGRWGPPRVLPLRPIFPGFYNNTLFYATIWFALIFGWRAHLRQVRKWQGYCPMCKYDLRSDLNHGCPECGWGRGRRRSTAGGG